MDSTSKVQIRFSARDGEHGNGRFVIEDGGEEIAFLAFHISGTMLTAIHTEVNHAAEGRGVGTKLVAAMVDYARKNGLTIVPRCPYVRAIFEKRPQEYADVWARS